MIRPLDQQPSSFEPRNFVDVLYATTLKRLKASDLDQEVKERAIASMAQIVANAGPRDEIMRATSDDTTTDGCSENGVLERAYASTNLTWLNECH